MVAATSLNYAAVFLGALLVDRRSAAIVSTHAVFVFLDCPRMSGFGGLL